ncbi:MAG: amidohydrolase family protein [Caldilineaceae bacterium]|nr:amidohydrolase family protein [Caldilineaceae bacterium]
MERIIRRAKLMDGRTVDIGIDGGRIAALAPTLDVAAAAEEDAAGRLTLPAFVNGQLHACKSFWRRHLHELPADVQALPRFQAAAHVKQRYTADDVFARVDETMRLALRHGTCAIRLFADVDRDSGLTALEGLLRIRAKYAPRMTVQIVAFPQDGMADAASVDLLRAALEMGADVVGGIPWIEPGEERQRQHVARCFDLAQEFDRDLHFVCDDVADPAVRSLEMVARAALARGFHGRVSATQCAALAFYPDAYAAQVIRLVADAGMTIFSNSHVSLIATEFPPRQPWPRGITRVRELLDAGVPVASGQDDIDNWFYPFGRNDMLEVAQFMAHNGQFAWRGEVDRVLPLVTTTPAHVLGLRDYGLHEGAAANLVILDAADWHTAIQFQAEKALVMLRGEVVVRNERRTEWGA